MHILKKLLGIESKNTSDEFIKKFMKEVSYKRVQMEVYNNNHIILIINSLAQAPSWIERGGANEEIYKNGFVIFLFFNKKKIKNNLFYENYLASKEQLDMVEFEDKINFVLLHFFDKNVTSNEINNYVLKIINLIYKFPVNDTQILFKLRY